MTACVNDAVTGPASGAGQVTLIPSEGDVLLAISEYGYKYVLLCAPEGVDPVLDVTVSDAALVQLTALNSSKTGAKCNDGRTIWKYEAFFFGGKLGKGSASFVLRANRTVHVDFSITVLQSSGGKG